MKKLRFVLSVVAVSLAMGTLACTSPVAPDCTDGAAVCHDAGSNN